jgi:hypothetical protein
LSSLLLVLLPVFGGIPGSERLFEITCLVVLLSVLLHGGGIAIVPRRAAAAAAAAAGRPAPLPQAPPAATPRDRGEATPERITIAEFRDLQRAGDPAIVVDVRTERSYRDDPTIAVGAIRFPPDDAVRLARERRLDQHATLVLYCA